MTLQDKNVLITGAYGGLGKAIAKRYLKEGANLYLVGRRLENLKEIVDQLELKNVYNAEIKYIACDLNSNSSIDHMIREIKRDFNRIDILVNCAAIFPIEKVQNMSIEKYQECMQVNLIAPFILIKEFSKEMVFHKWGRIINIASSSAYGGSPNTSAYCASKHGLLGLSRSLYKELKGDGVRVFCVSPGSIKTEMGREVEKLGQTYDTFMTPKEVADYVVYATSFDGHLISEEIRLNRLVVQ